MPHIRLYQGEANPSDVRLRSVPGIANTNLFGGISFGLLVDGYSETNQSSTANLFSGGSTGAGQSFSVSINCQLNTSVFYMEKNGSPTGNAVSKLYAITGTIGTDAKPTGPALAVSDNFDVSTLTTSFQLITFQFSGTNQYTLSSGSNYCITVEYSGGNTSNKLVLGVDATSPTHAGNISTLFNVTWSSNSPDLCFYVNRIFNELSDSDLFKNIQHHDVGQISFIGSLANQTLKFIIAILSFIGSISNNSRRLLSATLSFVGNFIYPWRQAGVLNFGTGPMTISGLKLWLKADSLSLNNGDAITSWTDSSGSANHGSGGSFGNAIYQTNIQNGLPVARFNGSSSGVNLPAGVISAQPDTVLVVANQASKSTTGTLIDTRTGSRQAFLLTTSGFLRISAGSNVTDASDHSAAFHVFTAIFNGISSFIYVDGTQVASGDANSNGGGPMSVGWASGAFLTGDIAEVLIYNSTLSTANRQFVESYLAVKYNISGPTIVGSIGGVLTKQTNNPLSGTLNFIGSIIKRSNKALTGTSDFIGLCFKHSIRALSASLTLAGAITRQTSKALAGVLSFIGSLTTAEVNVLLFTAALAFSGSVTRRTNKALTGTLSFIGSFTKTSGKLLSASLTFVGSLARRTNKVLTGILSFIGSLATPEFNVLFLTAALTFTGAVTKQTSRALSGMLSFVGAVTKQTNRSLSGISNFVGACVRTSLRSLQATLSLTGSLTKSTLKAISGTLSFIGSLITAEVNVLFLTATLAFSGTINKRTNRLLSGALNFIGSFIKNSTKPFQSTLGLAGDITKETLKLLSGILSFVGNIVTQYIPGSQTYFKVLSAALSFSGSVSKQTSYLLNATSTFVAACVKSTSKAQSGILDFVGLITKRTSKVFADILSFTGSLSTSEAIILFLTASLSFVGTTTKLTRRILIGILSFSGSIVRQCYNILSGSLGLSGILTKQAGRMLAGSLSFIGSISIVRMIRVALAAALSFSGFIVRRTGKSISGSYAFTGTVHKYISHSVASALSLIGSLGKRIPILLSATLSFIGTFSATILAHVYYVLAEGTLMFVGGINRSIFRPIIGFLLLSSEISKLTSRDLRGSISFIIRFIRWASFNKIWSVEVLAPPIFTSKTILSPITITATVLKS